MTPMKTISEWKQLPVAERLAVIEEIWESIVAEKEPIGIPAELGAELDRRLNEYHADPESGRLWSDIRDGH